MKKTSSLFLLFIFFVSGHLCASGAPVFDAANWFQNGTMIIKMGKQLEEQAQQTKHQFEQLSRLKDNLQNFHWNDVQGAINQLASDMERGKALAFSMQNLDSEFKRRFPGFEKTSGGKVDYKKQYSEWVDTNQHTMNNTMRVMGKQYKALENEKDLRNKLLNQARTADGSMKAVQIGNELAAEQVNQMQNLRQIMITQTNAMAEYQAFEAQRTSQKEQVMQDVISKLDANASTKYDSHGGFGQFGK